MTKQVKHFYGVGPFRLEQDEGLLLLLVPVEHSAHLMDNEDAALAASPVT
jgi:hypothetical protein